METVLRYAIIGHTFSTEWGFIDEKGIVYNKQYPGLSAASPDAMGYVDNDGYIYGTPRPVFGVGSKDIIGTIDKQSGNVYEGTVGLRKSLGYLDKEKGDVYEANNSVPVGHVDPPNDVRGAAAILLLLRPKSAPEPKPEPKSKTVTESTPGNHGVKMGGMSGAMIGLIVVACFLTAILGGWLYVMACGFVLLVRVIRVVQDKRHLDLSRLTAKITLKTIGISVAGFVLSWLAVQISSLGAMRGIHQTSQQWIDSQTWKLVLGSIALLFAVPMDDLFVFDSLRQKLARSTTRPMIQRSNSKTPKKRVQSDQQAGSATRPKVQRSNNRTPKKHVQNRWQAANPTQQSSNKYATNPSASSQSQQKQTKGYDSKKPVNANICPHCGAGLIPGSRFCDICGKQL